MPNPILVERLEALLELGSALIVGAVGADGSPRAVRASSWRVVATDPVRVRVAVCADDAVAMAGLERPGAWIAVTGANVTTLSSVQLKGPVVDVGPVEAEDLDLIERHVEVLARNINHADGHPLHIVYRFLPLTYVMVEFEVVEAFDQTPGPGAGAELAGHA